MSERKQVVIISGSPKPAGKAASDLFAEHARKALESGTVQARVIHARSALEPQNTQDAFAAMAQADAMIFIFPLYIFCLPGILMRFLQQYAAYSAAHAGKAAVVYAVVNCGFPEPDINQEAVEVIGRFAAAVGAAFRFGVMIGGGGMATVKAPPVRRMLEQYAQVMHRVQLEIEQNIRGTAPNVSLSIRFPRKLYFKMGNMGWKRQIKRNGKQAADLYARPYQRQE